METPSGVVTFCQLAFHFAFSRLRPLARTIYGYRIDRPGFFGPLDGRRIDWKVPDR
jgi:hypothetical protein